MDDENKDEAPETDLAEIHINDILDMTLVRGKIGLFKGVMEYINDSTSFSLDSIGASLNLFPNPKYKHPKIGNNPYISLAIRYGIKNESSFSGSKILALLNLFGAGSNGKLDTIKNGLHEYLKSRRFISNGKFLEDTATFQNSMNYENFTDISENIAGSDYKRFRESIIITFDTMNEYEKNHFARPYMEPLLNQIMNGTKIK